MDQQETSSKLNVSSNKEALLNLFFWEQYRATLGTRDKYLALEKELFDVYG